MYFSIVYIIQISNLRRHKIICSPDKEKFPLISNTCFEVGEPYIPVDGVAVESNQKLTNDELQMCRTSGTITVHEVKSKFMRKYDDDFAMLQDRNDRLYAPGLQFETHETMKA